MQGFIIDTKKVKNEDIVTTIITEKKIKTLYRFYGARHSIIHIGNKIDFEIENTNGEFLNRLRDISELKLSFVYDRDRLYFWQNFIKLFYEHFRDVENIDSFYFELLEQCCKKFEKQNPKRVVVEAIIKILEHEGRIHNLNRCHFCENIIESKKISLARAFLPAHIECIHGYKFDKILIENMLEHRSTLEIDDDTLELLYKIAALGF